MPSLSTRQATYYELSTAFAHFDNDQLKAIFQAADTTHGWGINHTIKVGKTKVFVKTVPITELEYAHPFATKNLYELPTYYNYGVGSAGFGVWRELVTHIKTTNWVLSGACENFPLMYHYRVVPRFSEYAALDMDRHERYVTYWNSNANISHYMLDRRNAKYELILFLEFFPDVLHKWLWKHLDQLNQFMDELRDTITFLWKNGIIHFDAHFGNIMTDGERPYLADFGLVLDKCFELSERERIFFKNNTHYDYGELLTGLAWLLRQKFDDLPEAKKKQAMQKYGMSEDVPLQQRNAILLENIYALYEDGVMKLDNALIGTCTLFAFHHPSRRAEIGYALGRPYWGQGYMHEALIRLVQYAFGDFYLNRLEADIDPLNTASAKVLERLGFGKEGRLRERWIVGDEVSDSDLYGLLRSDWDHQK